MLTYQTLETEKYWLDIESQRRSDIKKTRDRNAIEAFCTFLIGVAIVQASSFAFHYFYLS